MKNKEMVEKMSKDWDYVAHMLRFNDCYMLSLKQWSGPAKEMIKLGWIKPDKNSIVLTKDELNEIIKQTKETEKNYYKKVVIPQKLKETAEKYKIAMMLSIQEMQKYLEITKEQAKILYHHNNEIAKQFNIDIKEE